jgi:hypothetical protein
MAENYDSDKPSMPNTTMNLAFPILDFPGEIRTMIWSEIFDFYPRDLLVRPPNKANVIRHRGVPTCKYLSIYMCRDPLYRYNNFSFATASCLRRSPLASSVSCLPMGTSRQCTHRLCSMLQPVPRTSRTTLSNYPHRQGNHVRGRPMVI